MIVSFELNGQLVHADTNPGERLIHILRDRFMLLDQKEGCLAGRCGSCTVLCNGNPVPSCIMPMFSIQGASIVTLEGFRETAEYRLIVEGLNAAGVRLCGFCDAGKILVIHSLLQQSQRPGREEIRQALTATVCRCTSLEDIVLAIKKTGELKRKTHNAQ